jgi:hypothetical protein
MTVQIEHALIGNADCNVSKTQLLRLLEARFQMTDRDHDGHSNIPGLGNFLRFVPRPGQDRPLP